MCLWLLGYPDRAVQRSQEGVRLAQDLSAPINGCEAGYFAGLLRLFRGEDAAALMEAETLISRSAECGLLFFEVLGRLLRGGALSAQGRDQEGSAQLRQGLEISRATGSRMARPLFLAMLADASGRGGQSTEGLQTLAEAFELTRETGERIYEAELYRLAGELSCRMSQQEIGRTREEEKITYSPIRPFSHSSPEECFWKAIEIARQQQVKALELRATVSLARLWQRQGKQKEAHDMLIEIYNWFTEGFDTKDLQEAKRLIEEFS
jgi:predicted ATPase